MKRSRLAVVAVSVVTACAGDKQTSAPVSAELEGETIARVGSTSIPAGLVAETASKQQVTPREATNALIEDALAANGAVARGLDRTPSLEWARTSAIARTVIARIRDEARAAGAPTDAEVAEMTAVHWREVDLPEQARVIHAMVRRPKDKTRIAGAVAKAAELAKAVSGATSPDDFEQRAKAVPTGGFEILVQPVPTFVPDGQAAAEGVPGVVEPFARAAFTLQTPGAMTGVVETEFGWHLIRLLERLPAHRMPLEEKRRRFAEEAINRRAFRMKEGVLNAARGRTAIELLPGAEALMAEATARELAAP